jgi:gliding-associated putative ABC transporter substrate-binding component GldG
MKKQQIWTRVFIVLGIVVAINLIVSKVFFRLDFTADKRYTLSEATKDILGNMSEVVTITAYFSEDLPSQLLSSRKDFIDQLVEYENRSQGNVVYEFVNPNENEETEQKAQQAGIQPVIISVQERDQMKQLRAYMGAVVSLGDKKEVIPVIQPGASLEYLLTTAIKKLTVEEKPFIGFVQGHGEPSLRASMQVHRELSILYQVEPYTLSNTEEITLKYKSLAIIGLKDSISDLQLQKLDNFLKEGGRIYVSYSAADGDLSKNFINVKQPNNFDKWLMDKGIEISKELVTDINCAQVMAQQRMGAFTMQVPVQLPILPIVSQFGEHPITSGLESVMLPFASPIIVKDSVQSGFKATPIVYTSDKSGTASLPMSIDINKQWQEADFMKSKQALAVALEGSVAGGKPSKIVVVSCNDFAVNGEENPQQLQADNANLAINAIDWLIDDTGLIELRTKGVSSRPIQKIEDGKRELLKYGNLFAPILLILIYAFIRKQQYARKKQAWMEGKFD